MNETKNFTWLYFDYFWKITRRRLRHTQRRAKARSEMHGLLALVGWYVPKPGVRPSILERPGNTVKSSG